MAAAEPDKTKIHTEKVKKRTNVFKHDGGTPGLDSSHELVSQESSYVNMAETTDQFQGQRKMKQLLQQELSAGKEMLREFASEIQYDQKPQIDQVKAENPGSSENNYSQDDFESEQHSGIKMGGRH